MTAGLQHPPAVVQVGSAFPTSPGVAGPLLTLHGPLLALPPPSGPWQCLFSCPARARASAQTLLPAPPTHNPRPPLPPILLGGYLVRYKIHLASCPSPLAVPGPCLARPLEPGIREPEAKFLLHVKMVWGLWLVPLPPSSFLLACAQIPPRHTPLCFSPVCECSHAPITPHKHTHFLQPRGTC